MKVTELTRALLAERRRQRDEGTKPERPAPAKLAELRKAFETAQ
jgi:hypothetical protein